MTVEKVIPNSSSPLPSPRTYHSSCLMSKYLVTIGGESTSDLKDFWAFDLEIKQWFKPEIDFRDYYTAKRFHTINPITENKIVSFGGCHSEYVHLNEMHIFDLT